MPGASHKGNPHPHPALVWDYEPCSLGMKRLGLLESTSTSGSLLYSVTYPGHLAVQFVLRMLGHETAWPSLHFFEQF